MQRAVKNAGAAGPRAALREDTSEVPFYDSFIRPSSSARRRGVGQTNTGK